ncbi:MAG: hypothetical protein CM1200mP12_08660 [Gammaproteobacteria bacterium]|nr:MAG: hypothetical protein CM1200mP12_08660 [Gammaproteobacteria bacterium]
MVVDDADAHYQKAISCGAEIIFELKMKITGGEDTLYGPRRHIGLWHL